MARQILPASPNWYLSQICDANKDRTLVFGARHDIFIFDISKIPPRFVGAFTGHRERVSCVALGQSPGQLNICCSAADDCKVKLWDTGTKLEIQSNTDHKEKITAMSWSLSQTDLIVTGDERGSIVSWMYRSDVRQSFRHEKDHIFSLACCPHNADLLAVGYKSGTSLILNLKAGGQIIHRLRGHDDEIQSLVWCPEPGNSIFQDLDDPDEPETTEYLLASGSRDRTIRFWSTSKGRQVALKKLPTNAGYRRDHGDMSRGKVWLALCWPQNSPRQLISSSFGGELLSWDLSSSSDKQVFKAADGKGHTRIIFNVVLGGEDLQTLITVSMDRLIVFWDLPSLTAKCSLPSFGGHVYNIEVSPVDPGRIAVGVGDSMIRIWNMNNRTNPFDVNTLWQGIKSKVTALAWHPSKEGLLAYGTEDGRIGIFDILSNKPPTLSVTFHKRTVYVVAWGPPSDSSGMHQSKQYSLYSVGDGAILEHHPHMMNKEAADINSLIEAVNGINFKRTCPARTEISWKPDNSAVAVGNEDGTVDIFEAATFKHQCTIQVHRKLIICLKWHPQFTTTSPSGSPYQHWLASGGSDAVIHVVDLSNVFGLGIRSENLLIMTESLRKLEGHSIRVSDLTWNPHSDGELASVGYDSMAYVWDVKTGEAVKQFDGHLQRLLCVRWSGLDPDEVMSGGFDSTLQCWKVSSLPRAVIEAGGHKKKKKRKNNPPTDSKKSCVPQHVAKKEELLVEEYKSASPTNAPVEDEQPAAPTFASLQGRQPTPAISEIDELQDLLEKKRQELLQQQQQQQQQPQQQRQQPQQQRRQLPNEGSQEKDSFSTRPTLTRTGGQGDNADVFNPGLGAGADSVWVAKQTSETGDDDSEGVSIEQILGHYSVKDLGTKQECQGGDHNPHETSSGLLQSKRKKTRPKSVFPASAREENRGRAYALEDLQLLTKIKCVFRKRKPVFTSLMYFHDP